VDAPPGLHAAAAAPPRNPRRSGGARRVEKGGLRNALAAVRAAHPHAAITLWAEDEHRLGLLPVIRRLWAPRGQRPTAAVRRKYEWLSGFVRPGTGQSWWCVLPTVHAAAMSLALATFARDEGIDAGHRAVVVLDQAGWHLAHDLVVPDGIELVGLPAPSPELQPAERVWPRVDEPIANRAFPDLDALADILVDRCRTLEADRARRQAHTHFHWWPPEPAPILRL
jgi:transposase